MIEEIISGIFVLVSFAIYIWIYDAGCKKIEMKCNESYEKNRFTKFDVFYNNWVVVIWFIFSLYLWMYIVWKVTGAYLFNF